MSVWSPTGSRLGFTTVQVTGAGGWYEGFLSQPVPVTAGAVYGASYDGPNGFPMKYRDTWPRQARNAQGALMVEGQQPLHRCMLLRCSCCLLERLLTRARGSGLRGEYNVGRNRPRWQYLTSNFFCDIIFRPSS